ncbi:MAG TPA: lipid ABC transporter permease/ATP-binding protein, partial [Gammaproteobacteria bacterium]|nr:lipid ABC transporter permease/ATP-binding protein [Gammaproteobacteria bacterium]
TIHSGETVALVGPSGSGKSTLVSLIPRFYAPTEGSIFLDGIDLQEYELQALRQRIALVTQETQLFNDSIAANIAYGDNSGALDTEIEGAASAAHVMEFARPLDQGLDTDLGQNGGKVSGGQRQRIALARAFLKNAPILILDEATSALDNQSEEIIRQALEVLKANRTTIIIAHRLQTIEQADRIIVMDQGEIVQQGSHQQLMQQPGIYQTLYETLFRESENASRSGVP